MELSFRGTFAPFVPRKRTFQKLLFRGTFAPVELSFLVSERSKNFRSYEMGMPSSMERKFLEHSLLRSESSRGAKVPWNESSWTFRSQKFSLWTCRSRERKCRGTRRPDTIKFSQMCKHYLTYIIYTRLPVTHITHTSTTNSLTTNAAYVFRACWCWHWAELPQSEVRRLAFALWRPRSGRRNWLAVSVIIESGHQLLNRIFIFRNRIVKNTKHKKYTICHGYVNNHVIWPTKHMGVTDRK